MSDEASQSTPADAGRLQRQVGPCAWAHRYSPHGLPHALRDNQQDAEDDAAIVGGSAHAVALYDERALDEAVAAERERWRSRVEEAFRDGFRAKSTYNDTLLNTADEAWEEAKAGLLKA